MDDEDCETTEWEDDPTAVDPPTAQIEVIPEEPTPTAVARPSQGRRGSETRCEAPTASSSNTPSAASRMRSATT